MREPEACSLVFDWARTLCWHPVAAVQEFFTGKSYYQHVTIDMLRAAMRHEIEPIKPPYFRGEPIRVREDYIARSLFQYGCFCKRCKKVVELDYELDLNGIGLKSHWTEHGVCAPCLVKMRKAFKDARLVERTEEAIQQRDWNKVKRQIEDRKIAADRKRRLEKAAYAALEEMGMLDKIKDVA